VNFTGYLPQAQVMNLYRETGFDVFVNVSDAEGLPVSLMEASSAGIPMVATNVGGSNEIVNAANGVLLDADPSVDDIAAALLIFHRRAVAGVYRQRARSYWAKNYHAQVNYNKFGHDLACLVDHPANAGCFLK
jgi:glycosyltransferase involved in cell wall biosynthesis